MTIYLDSVTLIDDIIYVGGFRNQEEFDMEIPLHEFERYANQEDFFDFKDEDGNRVKFDMTEDYYCDGFGKLFHADLTQFLIAKKFGLC